MSTENYIPNAMSEDALKQLLMNALEDAPGWKSNETYHARFDHLERGITSDDVIYGIERGWTFGKPPAFNHNTWQWKYFLATKTIDGDPLTIIVAVDTANRTFEVVTRWKPEED